MTGPPLITFVSSPYAEHQHRGWPPCYTNLPCAHATRTCQVPEYAWGAGGGLFYGYGNQLGLTVLVLIAEISWTSVHSSE